MTKGRKQTGCSKNRARRKIFVRKREGITGYWRKLYNVERHDLYSSTNIRVIKSGRMRWVGHVARMEGEETEYRILVW